MKTRNSHVMVCSILSSFILAAAVMACKSPNATAATASEHVPAAHKLTPPSDGKPIPVAFVLTDGATVIDFSGPWEVFQDAGGPDGVDHFKLFTVGPSKNPIRTSGGMTIIPDYSFDDAPAARIVVIPAQRGDPKLVDWLRLRDKEADVVMSGVRVRFSWAKRGCSTASKQPLTMTSTTSLKRPFPRQPWSRAGAMFKAMMSFTPRVV
jgi:hypothetical protein